LQLPPTSSSVDTLLEYSDKVEDNLAAWADSELLSTTQQEAIQRAIPEIEAVSKRLRINQINQEATERARGRASLRYNVCDKGLDASVVALSDGLLNGPAARNRSDPRFDNVFQGKTASDYTGAPAREEPGLVRGLVERFDKEPDFTGKSTLRARIAASLDKSEGALKTLETSEQAERTASNEELSTYLELRQTLERHYNLLKAVFPGRRDFVEALFPRQQPGDKKISRTEHNLLSSVLLSILTERGLTLGTAHLQQVKVADKTEIFLSWITRAATAASVEAVFLAPEPTSPA
jgi:hypothetical protein